MSLSTTSEAIMAGADPSSRRRATALLTIVVLLGAGCASAPGPDVVSPRSATLDPASLLVGMWDGHIHEAQPGNWSLIVTSVDRLDRSAPSSRWVGQGHFGRSDEGLGRVKLDISFVNGRPRVQWKADSGVTVSVDLTGDHVLTGALNFPSIATVNFHLRLARRVSRLDAARLAKEGPYAAPEWRRRDEWAWLVRRPAMADLWYRWVIRDVQRVDGVEYYAIRSGDLRSSGGDEVYVRRADLALGQARARGIATRFVPPLLRFQWPLALGATWEQDYVMHAPDGGQSGLSRSVRWHVEGEESLTVPAGTFTALKISMRNKWSGQLMQEMWYAPALGQYVRLHEHSRGWDHQLMAFWIGG